MKNARCLFAIALAVAVSTVATMPAAKAAVGSAAVMRLKENTLRLRFRGPFGERMGGGFFVDTNGWILANLSTAEGAVQGLAETADGRKMPVKRVLAVSSKYDLVLLEAGGEREDALELALEGASRPGLEVCGIGMAAGSGWLELQGRITSIGTTTNGLPLLQCSGWSARDAGGGPVADAQGFVHGISTWNMVRKVYWSELSRRWVTEPTERTGCVPAPVMRRFLASPKTGMPLPEFGACHANAEVANWLMLMCDTATDAMILMQREVKAAGMEKRQFMQDNRGKLLSATPIHWRNIAGIAESIRSLNELKTLAAQTMPATAAGDARVRNALRYFASAMQSMEETVAGIRASDGLKGDGFWLKYDAVKNKFLQTNDFLYEALKNAMTAWQMYGRYTTQPSYLPATDVQRTLKFLETRGEGG